MTKKKRPLRTHMTVASALEGREGDLIKVPAVRVTPAQDIVYAKSEYEYDDDMVAAVEVYDLSGPGGSRKSIRLSMDLSTVDGPTVRTGGFLEIFGALDGNPELGLFSSGPGYAKVIDRPSDWHEGLRLVESAG